MRVHFGLGEAINIDATEIHWPSGAREMVRLPLVDRIYTITESKGISGVLCAQQELCVPAFPDAVNSAGSKP